MVSWTVTSGNAVTICCSGGRSALFLNSKSPIALLSARLPLTLPKSTKPPAAQIRAFSPSFCGLWSKDKGFARPFMPKTDRESPELPWVCQYSFHKTRVERLLYIRHISCHALLCPQMPCSRRLPLRTLDLGRCICQLTHNLELSRS